MRRPGNRQHVCRPLRPLTLHCIVLCTCSEILVQPIAFGHEAHVILSGREETVHPAASRRHALCSTEPRKVALSAVTHFLRQLLSTSAVVSELCLPQTAIADNQ